MTELNYAALLEEAYKPDLTDFYRPFEQEYEISKQLGTAARQYKTLGVRHKPDQLHRTWSDLHPGAAGSRIQDIGSDRFMTCYEEALRDADEVIEEVVNVHIPKLQMCADPIDEVSARSDPWQLIEFAERDRSEQIARELVDVREFYPFALSWSGRPKMERKEALRRLAVGSQFLSFEAVDPQKYVNRDVTAIADLFDARLFYGDTIRVKVSVVVAEEPDPKTGKVIVPDLPIMIGKDFEGPLPSRTRVETELFDCRIVQDGQRTVILSSKLRPKRRKSSIIKAARGRAVLDARGCGHIILGISEGTNIRAAAFADVEWYRDLVRERVWREQLVEIPDLTPPNPDSDSEFSRNMVKIMGRFVRQDYMDETLWVAPSVEHLNYSVGTHFMAKFEKNGSAHGSYRQRNVMSGVLKQWFDVHMTAAGLVLPRP